MIKRKFAGATLLAVMLLGGVGLAAYAMDNPRMIVATAGTGEALDAALNDRVETLLRSDVGLAGSQFRIQGKAGVITIGGTVPDEHALRRALDLASGVRGVSEIRNTLEITPPK